RDIITLPDPILRSKSTPVERVDNELLQLVDDMLETMYAAPGIGLAAIQVAVPKRLLVVDISRDEDARTPIVMMNPEILSFGDQPRSHEEGCLSIPDMYAELERPATIEVSYIDREEKKQRITAEGLLSTVIQHEMDHLDGILFIDHLSRLKRDRLVKKFMKHKKANETAI
ncbi:MAG: peptide deformylase, partial [Pseudomonadota bacterium]